MHDDVPNYPLMVTIMILEIFFLGLLVKVMM